MTLTELQAFSQSLPQDSATAVHSSPVGLTLDQYLMTAQIDRLGQLMLKGSKTKWRESMSFLKKLENSKLQAREEPLEDLEELYDEANSFASQMALIQQMELEQANREFHEELEDIGDNTDG